MGRGKGGGGKGGDSGPPKPNRFVERVMGKSMKFNDEEEDDGQMPEAPKHGATVGGALHMAEGATGFTYGACTESIALLMTHFRCRAVTRGVSQAEGATVGRVRRSMGS